MMNNIELESKIIEIFREDNFKRNTIHFLWDRAPFGSEFILRVVTRNPENGQIFLLKQVESPEGHHACLKIMLKYLEETYKDDNNYTVRWKDRNGEEQISYFRGKDKNEVVSKLYFANKNAEIIDEIKLMPIS